MDNPPNPNPFDHLSSPQYRSPSIGLHALHILIARRFSHT